MFSRDGSLAPVVTGLAPSPSVVTSGSPREERPQSPSNLHYIILCPHYEGYDERILSVVDYKISMGKYVLTGGELPAMVIADCVSRYVDGVISASSLVDESFSENMLEYPQYTRPQIYKGIAVPEILRSGDHAKVDAWRREQALALTQKRRPDLLK